MRFTMAKPRLVTTLVLAFAASSLPISVAAAATPATGHPSRTPSSTAAPALSASELSAIAPGFRAGRCLVLDNLTEHFIPGSGSVTGAGPNPSEPTVGQRGTYSMRIVDAAGDQIGSMLNGTTYVYAQAANGDFLSQGDEHITLNDGAIHAEGNYDLSATLAHNWQAIPAVGTSGRYRGMHGVELFYDVVNPVLFDEAFVMCR